jgi:hypothetical protein
LLAALWHNDELYLFDPQLGLPISTGDGARAVSLSAAAEDASILRSMDLPSAGGRYPLQSEDLKDVRVFLEASPSFLTGRMKILESKLAGRDQLVLSVDVVALNEQIAEHPNVRTVRLWEYPLLTLRENANRTTEAREAEIEDLKYFAFEPHLWKALVLQFQGPATREGSLKSGFGEAIDFYRTLRVSPQITEATRGYATYRLGLVTFDQGRPETAVDYFDKRTLAATPDGPWTDGARYNLARSYEATGQIDKAIATYLASQSPQRHGDWLRAERLRGEVGGAAGVEP